MMIIDEKRFRERIDETYPFDKTSQEKHGIADIAKGEILRLLEEEMAPLLKEQEGQWIETGNVAHIDIDNVILYQEMCDKCKGLSYFRKSANKLIGAKNCPNCGAKMEV